MRYWLVFFAAFVAVPAWGGTWTGAGQSGTPISSYDAGFFSFTSADSASDTAAKFTVKAPSALFCFIADTGGSPVGTAQVQPRLWPQGDTTAGSGFSIAQGGANGNAYLDGTGGTASTQNACIRIGPGVYTLDIQTACAGGNTCLLSVKGEGL